MSSTLTPAADFFAQYAPPRPPVAPSLDLDAGAVIRLTRRADDAGYELVTFAATPPASAPPTPEPPAKPDEPTLTPVRRGADALKTLVRPAKRKGTKFMRAVSLARQRRLW